MAADNRSLWIARVCIGAVLLANVQCAVVFWWSPQIYAPTFELAGVSGEAAVRGIGVLFLMWNVPYVIALWHPRRHRVSLWEAVAMQTIGVAGETFIALTLPPGYVTLRASLTRFILFDGSGLAALLLAAWLSRPRARQFSG